MEALGHKRSQQEPLSRLQTTGTHGVRWLQVLAIRHGRCIGHSILYFFRGHDIQPRVVDFPRRARVDRFVIAGSQFGVGLSVVLLLLPGCCWAGEQVTLLPLLLLLLRLSQAAGLAPTTCGLLARVTIGIAPWTTLRLLRLLPGIFT